jgi:molecular chaperone GrpE
MSDNPQDEEPVVEPTSDARVAEMTEQLASLQRDRDALQDRLLRAIAEFDNWRKRAQKEMSESERRGRIGLVRSVLPVADHLERALQYAAREDPIATGVRMVLEQLTTLLEKQGITRFHPLGDPFDPTRHEAVDRLETVEMPAGTVAQVLAPGYLHEDRLLRPALVTVSALPTTSESDAEDLDDDDQLAEQEPGETKR